MSNNVKTAVWYGGHLGPFLSPTAGDIFYVNGSTGANTNDGLTPLTAVLTITYAISLCAAGNDDYIFVLSYPGAAAGETFPLAMATSKVHLIGTPTQASPSPSIVSAAGHAILVTASNCEISGFNIGATDGSSAGIATTGTIWKTHIHDNEIGWIQACQDGVLMTGATDVPHTLVENNKFGNAITRDGIRIEHNSTRSVFKGNLFSDVAGAGINVTNELALAAILNNVFRIDDAAAGEAILLAATAVGQSVIDGNHAAEGAVALAFNPYRDLGTNDWGLNYSGIVPTYPVTV